MNKLLRLPLVLAAALAAVGCGALEEDLCDARAECERWGDRDYENCVYDYEDVYRDADRRGCLDEYDDWLACQDDTYDCRGGDWDTNCGPERDDLQRCLN